MPDKSRVITNVSLTRDQRHLTNRQCVTLNMSYSAFMCRCAHRALADTETIARLVSRVRADRDRPKSTRANYTDSKSASIDLATHHRLWHIARTENVKIGAVIRAAVTMQLEDAPTIYVAPDKVINKMAKLVEEFRDDSSKSEPIRDAYNKWARSPAQPTSWIDTIEEFAAFLGIKPWEAVRYLHSVAVDYIQKTLDGDGANYSYDDPNLRPANEPDNEAEEPPEGYDDVD